jgi:hypothetical protein
MKKGQKKAKIHASDADSSEKSLHITYIKPKSIRYDPERAFNLIEGKFYKKICTTSQTFLC